MHTTATARVKQEHVPRWTSVIEKCSNDFKHEQQSLHQCTLNPVQQDIYYCDLCVGGVGAIDPWPLPWRLAFGPCLGAQPLLHRLCACMVFYWIGCWGAST